MTKEEFVHSFQVMAEFQEDMQNPEAQTICIDYCRKMELCGGKKYTGETGSLDRYDVE